MDTAPRYPLSVGDILDTAFRIYRRDLTRLLLISAALQVPLALLGLLLLALLQTTWLTSLLSSLVVAPLVSGALMVAASAAWRGEPVAIGAAYRISLRNLWSQILSQLLLGLMALVAAVPLIIGLVLDAALRSWLGTLLGGLLTLGLVLWLSVRYSLIGPAVVLEEQGASRGLERSAELTHGHARRVFGVLIAVGLLSALINSPVMLVRLTHDTTLQLMLSTLAPTLVAVITLPLTCAVTTVLYRDLRARAEGQDLEQRAAQIMGAQHPSA